MYVILSHTIKWDLISDFVWIDFVFKFFVNWDKKMTLYALLVNAWLISLKCINQTRSSQAKQARLQVSLHYCHTSDFDLPEMVQTV